MSDLFDKSDFDAWLKNPITQDILKSYKERRELLVKQLCDMSINFDLKDYYRILFMRGVLSVYEEIINISYSDMGENQSD